MSTDSQPNRQWPQSDVEQQDSSQSYALSGRIMLASIIILFVVVVSLVFLHLYTRWYILRLRLRNVNRRRRNRSRSTRIVFYVDNNRPPASPAGALDASVLKSLPVFVYSPKSDVDMPECAVCLSEFEEGEKGRILPKCKHSFHTECIDMWFHSNSTCPLCRTAVEVVETVETEVTISVEEQGDVTETSSSTTPFEQLSATTSFAGRMKRVDVRIDVPSWNESEFQLASPSQGFRSPGSRLLALKRIISMSRKSPAVSPSSGVGPSCVAAVNEADVESAREESANDSSRPGSIS